MNLIIDIGNTVAKLAVFQQDELLLKVAVQNDFVSQKISELFEEFSEIEKIGVSNVSATKIDLSDKVSKKAKIVVLSGSTPLPFKNLYATPATLGNDRKALIAAATKFYPAKHVLVIDAGTCITYDFKNKEEEYLGGGISPGLKMRFLALNTFTANLPLTEAAEAPALIGNTTVSSIQSGVVNGVLLEIDGIMERYAAQYGDMVTIITGGDATFLSINLKNGIFANSNFLLEGLNYILEFNIDQ
ncbi:type III pantothenate kinase [Salinimicrobium oceani]|uniref:Type III pantothenate kinase n=1 Tax=Salinimicrobium oceani TaxID=2722702 RepID=A0ABX1D364_9FLAO|nr:type III pantothenate kinase [Salinimicrobium oceani]NJW53123.1 type III pantothenate kinase [Salinimicrobium oceani]